MRMLKKQVAPNDSGINILRSEPSQLVEYDNLSIQLFSGLAENALSNISSSAGKMLDVACLFFDKDVSVALLDFNKLYLQHAKLDAHNDCRNQYVDDILESVQDANSSETTLIAIDTASQNEVDDLAQLQKELEALIQQDNHIKQRMVPVMQCMQYEDLVINRIRRLITCWEYMVTLLNSVQQPDISDVLQTFNGFLSSEDEHEKFYKHVLHLNYQDHIESKLQDISPVEHSIDSINVLFERLFEFSQASLNDCIIQTQHAFEELMTLLDLVTGESADVAYLFADNTDTLVEIKSLLKKQKADVETKQLIQKIEATKAKHNEETSALIQSFMVALQSQDAIRQNIENIGKFHQVWRSYRSEIINENTFNNEQRIKFGNEIMEQMTSHVEREIIEKTIPGVDISSNSDEDIFF